MGKYLIRRLLIAIPSLIGISIILFTVLALAPGDPFEELATNPNVPPEVRQNLVAHAKDDGVLRWGTKQEASTSSARVGEMLQLIASVREFQYA